MVLPWLACIYIAGHHFLSDGGKTGMNDIYFIYDGECPVCNYAAHALRIRQAVGNLHLINAREEKQHPLINEVNKKGLDLDEGMVIFYQDNFYHGQDALHLMGLIGSDSGWFNKANAFLFRSKPLAKFCYPALRGIRNTLIRLKGASKIDNLNKKTIPIFQSIFGQTWDSLPPVMKRHYANHPYCSEEVAVEGALKIEASRIGRLFFPLFKLMKTLIPREGNNIQTTVRFITSVDNNEFQFDRYMRFPDGASYRFHSRMKPVGGNVLVETMSCGLGWRMAYEWTGEKVILQHKGYALNLFGFFLPLPIRLIMGAGYAEETPINDNEFSMITEIRHPLWGKIYGYSGCFKVVKDI
jgi:predicted DCC family thiol-disulfide oxidoreductase YuxK